MEVLAVQGQIYSLHNTPPSRQRDEGIVCAARNCGASHRRQGLAPRCRLVASWGWSRSQGLGCSPIKAVRELGLERRETVRIVSAVGAGDLRGADLSTRGPGRTDRWCTGCSAKSTAG